MIKLLLSLFLVSSALCQDALVDNEALNETEAIANVTTTNVANVTTEWFAEELEVEAEKELNETEPERPLTPEELEALYESVEVAEGSVYHCPPLNVTVEQARLNMCKHDCSSFHVYCRDASETRQ